MSTKFSRKRLAEYTISALKKDSPDIARELAAYLTDRNKTHEVNSLVRDILQLRADQLGTVEVTAVVAHPLETDIRRSIEESIRYSNKDVKKVIINERVDSSVIGGIRLEFANSLLDTTVKNRLNSLKSTVEA